MNPGHKQKKLVDDTPQWYTDACIDAMTAGMGVVKVTLEGGEYKAERIEPAKFLEMSDALNQLHSQIKE
jgi:hypothetical protein